MYEIEDKLGLWCSIGIAANKFLAKMASEIKKPRGITALGKQDIQAKLWPLQVKEIRHRRQDCRRAESHGDTDDRRPCTV
jgi:nucleotidyltransferase/DNA polymerase involved in DNA repair